MSLVLNDYELNYRMAVGTEEVGETAVEPATNQVTVSDLPEATKTDWIKNLFTTKNILIAGAAFLAYKFILKK